MATATLPIMPPAPPVAVPHSKHYEVVNGEFMELPPMGARESILASVLGLFLANWALPREAGHVVVELLFQLDAKGPLQRRPDVAFVSAARWPLDKSIPDEAAWPVVPNLAVEVISPSNTMNEVMEKIDEYFEYGVERVWIVLPKQRRVQVFHSPTLIQTYTLNDTIRDDDLLPELELTVASFIPERIR